MTSKTSLRFALACCVVRARSLPRAHLAHDERQRRTTSLVAGHYREIMTRDHDARIRLRVSFAAVNETLRLRWIMTSDDLSWLQRSSTTHTFSIPCAWGRISIEDPRPKCLSAFFSLHRDKKELARPRLKTCCPLNSLLRCSAMQRFPIASRCA